MACPVRGKRPTGGGETPHDCWTVPICGYHHREGPDAQHRVGEKLYWELRGIDQFALALSLWEKSGAATRAAERKANPAPIKPRKIKARDRDAPKRKIPGRALQSRSTFPPSRGFSRPIERRT